MLDFIRPGSSLLLRRFCHLDLTIFLIQTCDFGTPLLILDFFRLESFVFSRSLSCLDSFLPAFRTGDADFSLSLHSFGRLGLAALLAGILQVGSIYSLFVIDGVTLDFLLFVQSSSQIGSLLSAPAAGHLGPLSSPHSPAYLGSAVFTFSLGGMYLGLPMLLRNSARVDSIVFALSSARTDLSPPVLAFSHVGFLVFARSPTRPELMILTLSLADVDLLLSLREFARLGSAVSVLGLNRTDSIFFLFVIGIATCGSLLFLRSFGQSGLALFVAGFGTVGFPLPSRAHA